MTTYQHMFLDGEARRWAVDEAAVTSLVGWARRSPELLHADLAGMAQHFPHWLLVGSHDEKPLRCPTCAALAVPMDGDIRCAQCWQPCPATGVLWMGHLPVLARPEPVFARRQRALCDAGFSEVTTGDLTHLLVPLKVRYPAEWPNEQATVRYAGHWLDLMGLPRSSAAHHIIGGGDACLFGWNEWYAMPIHSLLQQRVVNHIVSLFKIVAGQPPREAFIGRVAH
jgi:hypothetical protein